ncbi:uncharacterized protein B0H18DRAFT_957800 [Fomitopsis serialis]|uniref:uncharacterized protein n=1 Tax=Fomitopsis serialis TaxID=139415 RepID=UPI0020084F75|nr:uncharacterized protein B0H18DRAFT_957800 [Neoantrodia serialis]KAH9918805.1 hypothetical protein B0H18DRAFT_957800 [Neoantrodia serialis]
MTILQKIYQSTLQCAATSNKSAGLISVLVELRLNGFTHRQHEIWCTMFGMATCGPFKGGRTPPPLSAHEHLVRVPPVLCASSHHFGAPTTPPHFLRMLPINGKAQHSKAVIRAGPQEYPLNCSGLIRGCWNQPHPKWEQDEGVHKAEGEDDDDDVIEDALKAYTKMFPQAMSGDHLWKEVLDTSDRMSEIMSLRIADRVDIVDEMGVWRARVATCYSEGIHIMNHCAT